MFLVGAESGQKPITAQESKSNQSEQQKVVREQPCPQLWTMSSAIRDAEQTNTFMSTGQCAHVETLTVKMFVCMMHDKKPLEKKGKKK